jgi:hypothetical protein
LGLEVDAPSFFLPFWDFDLSTEFILMLFLSILDYVSERRRNKFLRME